MYKSGVETGNINNSNNFIPTIRPYFANAVRQLVTGFLTKPMLQTGFPPPLAVTGDGGTYKHQCRQM